MIERLSPTGRYDLQFRNLRHSGLLHSERWQDDIGDSDHSYNALWRLWLAHRINYPHLTWNVKSNEKPR